MPWTDGSLQIRAEHPKRVHIDRQMQEIRVKKTAGDQLPQLEAHLTLGLGQRKMANGPERERGEETRTGDRFQRKHGDVRTE